MKISHPTTHLGTATNSVSRYSLSTTTSSLLTTPTSDLVDKLPLLLATQRSVSDPDERSSNDIHLLSLHSRQTALDGIVCLRLLLLHRFYRIHFLSSLSNQYRTRYPSASDFAHLDQCIDNIMNPPIIAPTCAIPMPPVERSSLGKYVRGRG